MKTKRSKNNTRQSKEKRKLLAKIIKRIRAFIVHHTYVPHTKKALAVQLKISKEELSSFYRAVSLLEETGSLEFVSGKIHARLQAKIVRGTLSVHPRGFGFVTQPAPQDDLFIPRRAIRGAVDGDLVEVQVESETEKGPEGKILAVIERKRRQIVGTVCHSTKRLARVYSSFLGELHLVSCPLRKGERVQDGDRVVLDVIEWGKERVPETVSLARVIGHVDDPFSDLSFIIEENELRTNFSQKALDEAKACGKRVRKDEYSQRVDLRDLLCVTIDPDTAKDFDDAISLERKEDGYRLGVHIADVSHYVRDGTTLDVEAALRSNSTYFCSFAIPMLPRDLSENLCSLKPLVDRLAVSVFIDLDRDGNTISWEIVRSVIHSRRRFTYGDVREILENKKKSQYRHLLCALSDLCRLLQQQRHARGSVQLYIPASVIRLDDQGVPSRIEIEPYDISHQMIEECMVKANEVVAMHLTRLGKSLSYRVHEQPAQESLRDFAVLVSVFGFSLPMNPSPQDIQNLFLEIEGSSYESYLALCYIKTMRLACYSPDNIGHYGLSLEHYCHFTSPIRRYVDILVHRLLFEEEKDRASIIQICETASERERVSARAEGAFVKLKKLRLLQQEQENFLQKEYRAIITRVKPYGIYFDLVDYMLEGFLHVSELEQDFFLFDEETVQLVGESSGFRYRSGDGINVQVTEINLLNQTVVWQMVRGKKRKK